ERARDVEVVDVVAEGVGARLGLALVAAPGEGGLVVAAGALAELREDLLERALAEAADGPGRDGEEAGLLVALEVAAVLELLDEVAEPHPVGVVVGEAVLLVELGEPAER